MRRITALLKRPFVVMPVVALAVFSGWVVQSRGSGSTAAASPTDQVVEVTVGTLAKTVSAQGTVAAAESKDMTFSASGTVTAVNVKAGQTVNKGDVLATMDSPTLRQAVADAESRLASAKATLSDDTANGASDSRLTADKSNVTTAQDSLDQANTDLAGANLIAPYTAKITAVRVNVGDNLGSTGSSATTPTGSASGSGLTSNNLGGTSTTSTAAISLISLDSYTVTLGFDASDISDIVSGQAAKITLSTASSTTNQFGGGGPQGGFQFGGPTANATTATTTATASNAATTSGVVDSVSTVADASSGVASYPVTVTFNDSTGSFNVGATVSVEVTISEIKDAVQVSSAAVTSDGNQSTVVVRKNGKDETRVVTTGLTSGGMVQITNGLQKGEQVVISVPSFGNRNNTPRANTSTNGAGS